VCADFSTKRSAPKNEMLATKAKATRNRNIRNKEKEGKKGEETI